MSLNVGGGTRGHACAGDGGGVGRGDGGGVAGRGAGATVAGVELGADAGAFLPALSSRTVTVSRSGGRSPPCPHSEGCGHEIRAAERKRLACDAYFVQFLHPLACSGVSAARKSARSSSILD